MASTLYRWEAAAQQWSIFWEGQCEAAPLSFFPAHRLKTGYDNRIAASSVPAGILPVFYVHPPPVKK